MRVRRPASRNRRRRTRADATASAGGRRRGRSRARRTRARTRASHGAGVAGVAHDDRVRGHRRAVRRATTPAASKRSAPRCRRDTVDAARRQQPLEPPAHARARCAAGLGLIGDEREARACARPSVGAQSMRASRAAPRRRRRRRRPRRCASIATARGVVAPCRPCREQARRPASRRSRAPRSPDGDMSA